MLPTVIILALLAILVATDPAGDEGELAIEGSPSGP